MRRAALALLLLSGCSEPERTPLLVFAASSLTEAFDELERAFEATHPSVDVRPTYAGSQALRLQIAQGAPADVFASADLAHVAALVAAGSLEAPATFAHNELALIVPDRPGAIERFEALDRAERIVVGAPSVPVGRYTERLLERAATTHGEPFARAVRAAVASEETNVRLVRAKVELGEADAAFVYRTDVGAGVCSVPIPAELNVRARYPIAVVRRTDHRAEASNFVAFVRSPEGRAILERHRFHTEAP